MDAVVAEAAEAAVAAVAAVDVVAADVGSEGAAAVCPGALWSIVKPLLGWATRNARWRARGVRELRLRPLPQ